MKLFSVHISIQFLTFFIILLKLIKVHVFFNLFLVESFNSFSVQNKSFEIFI